MNQPPFTADSAKLNEAMRKLEDYSLQQIKSQEESSVSKTIGLVRSILIAPFDTRLKKHKHQRVPPNKHEVLTAIEFINRNRLFIEQLKQGTPDERELAEKYTKTINNYNKTCDKRIQGCKSRVANFFTKEKPKEQPLPRIAMLKKASIQRHYPENSAYKALQKQYSNTEMQVPIPKQLSELFHMKTISLLEQYGIASNPEARAFVKRSPIFTNVEQNGSICTLIQTFSLFPGQTIVVKGNATLDPKTHALGQLLPESFTFKEDLPQTGFPHSTQRAGWTLASQLIPDSPQRIDLLNHAADIFQQKNQAVAALLQKGDLLRQAKTLFSLKKKAFAEHAEELIGLHETLAMTILRAASENANAMQTVKRFYEYLRTHPDPYAVLTETSQLIRDHFMAQPHQTLLDAIIKGKSTDLGSNVPGLRYGAAKAILDQAVDNAEKEYHPNRHDVENLEERIKSNYIGCIGTVLGKAAKPIFLQYLSEDLIFTPPSLSAFEKQVQDAAYLHLKEFLDELSTPLQNDPVKDTEMAYQLLKKQLGADIVLFHQGESKMRISHELADYFHKRYLSLSAI
jgi:hypothetical protein